MTNEADSDHYVATRFQYASNQTAVTYIVGEEWNWDGDPWSDPTDYGIAYAREFRYDQARARYLNRELDPVKLMLGQYEALSETWSDYDGDEVYGDFEVNGGDVTNLRSFEPGMAKADPWTSTGSAATTHYHGDIIGTTRVTSDPGGAAASPTTYTAFGERIEGANPRYGYAGAWGYQAHDECPYLHVGARYYDPETGRFLQRDPIGIRGGLNVYAYVRNTPTDDVDPEGLQRAVRPFRPGRMGPPQPYEPPGFRKFPQPYTPYPDIETPKTFPNLATNCFMLLTGGPYIPNPKPVPTPGPRVIERGRPPRPDGHPLWYPLRAAAFAALLYALGWSVAKRKHRCDFEKHTQGTQG